MFFSQTPDSANFQISRSVYTGMGVRSIMRVLIRDVFRAPACHLRSPLQLIIRRIRRTGILIGSSRRGHGPSCVRVLRHAMRRAVCRAAVALARELSPILSQRLWAPTDLGTDSLLTAVRG